MVKLDSLSDASDSKSIVKSVALFFNLQYVEACFHFFDERSGLEEVKVKIVVVANGVGEVNSFCLVVQQKIVIVEEVNFKKLKQQVNLFFCHFHLLHYTTCSQNFFSKESFVLFWIPSDALF